MTVNAIAPGLTRTPGTMARQPDPDAVEDPEEFVEFAKLCAIPRVARVRAGVRAVRRRPGPPEQPPVLERRGAGILVGIVEWDSLEAHQEALTSAAGQRFLAAIEPLTNEFPDVKFYQPAAAGPG